MSSVLFFYLAKWLHVILHDINLRVMFIILIR